MKGNSQQWPFPLLTVRYEAGRKLYLGDALLTYADLWDWNTSRYREKREPLVLFDTRGKYALSPLPDDRPSVAERLEKIPSTLYPWVHICATVGSAEKGIR